MTIREFVDSDIPALLTVNAAGRPGVAPLDREELLALRQAGARILIAGEESATLGYLIAFDDYAGYRGEEFLHFRGSLKHAFVYIDQIAIDPTRHRTGVARALYGTLFAMGRSASVRYHCCEVNLAPPNPVSLEFHHRMGFRQTTRMRVTDGREVALLVRDC
jgi:predicted GNAT superfamily acetyltransferase